ncbi:MAG: hypothetical protein ACRD82_02550, partial [Blastocatellia bacterium]
MITPHLGSAKSWKLSAIASIVLSIIWLYSVASTGVSAANSPLQQQSQTTATLTAGEVVERELAGNAVHHYKFSLPAGQYLRLSIEQKGVAIISTLLGSGGEKLIEADYAGKESLSVIAPLGDGKPSNYRVEVRSRLRGNQFGQTGQTNPASQPGRYVIKIEEQRPATPRDEDRVKAERMVADATQL